MNENKHEAIAWKRHPANPKPHISEVLTYRNERSRRILENKWSPVVIGVFVAATIVLAEKLLLLLISRFVKPPYLFDSVFLNVTSSVFFSWILVAVGCIFLGIAHIERRYRVKIFGPRRGIPPNAIRSFLYRCTISIGIAIVASGLFEAIPFVYAVAHHLSPISFSFSLAGLLLFLGWSAHVCRQKSQYWYGFTEIVVAVLFILDRCLQLSSIDTLPSNWGTLVGAVYFLVRGLNNYRDGGEELRTKELMKTNQ